MVYVLVHTVLPHTMFYNECTGVTYLHLQDKGLYVGSISFHYDYNCCSADSITVTARLREKKIHDDNN